MEDKVRRAEAEARELELQREQAEQEKKKIMTESKKQKEANESAVSAHVQLLVASFPGFYRLGTCLVVYVRVQYFMDGCVYVRTHENNYTHRQRRQRRWKIRPRRWL